MRHNRMWLAVTGTTGPHQRETNAPYFWCINHGVPYLSLRIPTWCVRWLPPNPIRAEDVEHFAQFEIVEKSPHMPGKPSLSSEVGGDVRPEFAT